MFIQYKFSDKKTRIYDASYLIQSGTLGKELDEMKRMSQNIENRESDTK